MVLGVQLSYLPQRPGYVPGHFYVMVMMMKIEYSANNSGGSWWLSDADWKNLEDAGWDVDWVAKRDSSRGILKADSDGRWLGALAMRATVEAPSMGEAIAQWERITGQLSNELGCNCCGAPHSFSAYDDDGNYVDSYYPEARYGDRYE